MATNDGKHTEASMIDLLHDRYGTRSQGNGNRYVAMSHVRSDAGFDAERTADFMALDLWPSKGLMLHGHEVKISRSDWLNELKDPEKSEAFTKHVDYWWLVIADSAMVRPGELPRHWGMMTVGGDGKLRVVRQAPRLTVPEYRTNKWGQNKPAPAPVHRGLVASMLRAAAKSARNREVKAHEDWIATHVPIGQEWEASYNDAEGNRITKAFPDEASARAWRTEQPEPWKIWIEMQTTYSYKSKGVWV